MPQHVAVQNYQTVPGRTLALTQAPKFLPSAPYHKEASEDMLWCCLSLGRVLFRFSCRSIAKRLFSGDCEAFAVGKKHHGRSLCSAYVCLGCLTSRGSFICPHEKYRTVQPDRRGTFPTNSTAGHSLTQRKAHQVAWMWTRKLCTVMNWYGWGFAHRSRNAFAFHKMPRVACEHPLCSFSYVRHVLLNFSCRSSV